MKQALALAAATLLTVPAFAGVVYEVENRDLNASPATVTTANISIEGLLMKMDMASAGEDWDGEMIFRGDRREMVIVDHKEQSYLVIDEEQLRAISEKVNQAMASMQQALSAMPESQRVQMEQNEEPDAGHGRPT